MNDDDYEVGYQKPPKHTRFQKGRSGNPKGRKPKLNVDYLACFQAALLETVNIQENNKSQKITKIDAVCKSVINKAIMGDKNATKMVFELLKENKSERALDEMFPYD